MDGSKGSLRSLAPGVHVCAAPQRFLGIELGARMSVLELEGGLFVCSPVPVEPARVREALGEAPRGSCWTQSARSLRSTPRSSLSSARAFSCCTTL